jgi:hypothetical protein
LPQARRCRASRRSAQSIIEGSIHEALQLGISSIRLRGEAGLTPTFRGETAAAGIRHPYLDRSKSSPAKGGSTLA